MGIQKSVLGQDLLKFFVDELNFGKVDIVKVNGLHCSYLDS